MLDITILQDNFVFLCFLRSDRLELPVREWRRGPPSQFPDNSPSPLSVATCSAYFTFSDFTNELHCYIYILPKTKMVTVGLTPISGRAGFCNYKPTGWSPFKLKPCKQICKEFSEMKRKRFLLMCQCLAKSVY